MLFRSGNNLLEDLNNQQVADQMYITPHTVAFWHPGAAGSGVRSASSADAAAGNEKVMPSEAATNAIHRNQQP